MIVLFITSGLSSAIKGLFFNVKFNQNLPETDGYLALFLNDTPLLDVRAPIEFAEGHFLNSHNSPLLNNTERHKIGIAYKQKNQQAAIQLGLELITGDVKEQRINTWKIFAQKYPEGVLYCFRGGLRSKISQQWLYEATGIHYPRVTGGYKKLRAFLSEQLEKNSAIMHPIILAGATGTGKTELLKTVHPHIDLEGLALHRGSAFGRRVTKQPSQMSFECAVSQALLKIVQRENTYYIAEDESTNIGARHIPSTYFDHLGKAPLVVLHASLEERIQLTLQEYVHNSLAEYQAALGQQEQAFITWTHYLLNSLERLQKRLGNTLYEKIYLQMHKAIHIHQTNGNTKLHADWIHLLLVGYYDKMYQHQLKAKNKRIVFQGNKQAVIDFLATKYAIL